MKSSGYAGHSRRHVIGALSALAAGLLHGRPAWAQEGAPAATPGASPAAQEWTYTDVLGKRVSLPERPARIAANLVTGAALWDLGIRPVAVFDWTASAHPDGDHIAWGNVDPAAVAKIGDANGDILPEDLVNTRPDIILTLTFDRDDPAAAAGVPPEMAERIEQIAPVLVVTDMASTEIQLERLVELAVRLGADVNAPEIAAARADYEAKVDEFREVVAIKSDVAALFANFDPDAFYVPGPRGVPELQFLGALGLRFANAGSMEAAAFWETLSVEQALKYPSDLVYSTFQSIEELRAQPVYGAMPAVVAGQVGEWPRDFPVSYAGVSGFLDVILASLRTAEKVTE